MTDNLSNLVYRYVGIGQLVDDCLQLFFKECLLHVISVSLHAELVEIQKQFGNIEVFVMLGESEVYDLDSVGNSRIAYEIGKAVRSSLVCK